MDRRDFIQGGIAALVLGTSAGASVPPSHNRELRSIL
jgi:hypothetical protein